MEIIPYEDLKITTMTMIMSLTNGCNVEAAFYLLPITKVAIPQTRESSKCKLPHCDVPGSILSMRYRNDVRGIIRSRARPFKNAVTIDISTHQKNISLKLSSFSIQMCGASSRECAVEAATYVLNHLKHIQRMLDRIHADPAMATRTMQWVLDATRGDPIEKSSWESNNFTNVTLQVYAPITDHTVVMPAVPIPEDIDADLVDFYLRLAGDFVYHSDFQQKISFIPSIQTIIDEPLEIDRIDEAMVNYNYSLGFEVDRFSLNRAINGKNGFISRYHNALASQVTIELPYEPSPESAMRRRKNKIPKHTFLVYRSGAVTQSGPGGEIMRDAYMNFMGTIAALYDQIQYSVAASSV